MSKYGVISGPYFPVFGLNTGKYGLEITPYFGTFHAVIIYVNVWGYSSVAIVREQKPGTIDKISQVKVLSKKIALKNSAKLTCARVLRIATLIKKSFGSQLFSCNVCCSCKFSCI